MNAYLVISALGEDQTGIVNALSKTIMEHQCNIDDSRMSVLGGEFAIILLVSGNKENILQLEELTPELQNKLGLTIICRRTQEQEHTKNRLPYNVTAVSIDHPGIVQQIADYFSSRNINIESLTTDTYPAAHTGTPMFRISMLVYIAADSGIITLRDEFINFCEDMNIDATLEASTR